MGLVRVARISSAGQIFLPADVRRRWAVREVTLTDLGGSVLVEPVRGASAPLTPPKG